MLETSLLFTNKFIIIICIPNFTGIDGVGLALTSHHHKLGRFVFISLLCHIYE